MATTSSCFVVFGANEQGLPHGGRFGPEVEKDAQAAAANHKYSLLPVTNPAAEKVAQQVPEARLSAAGNWLLLPIPSKLAEDLGKLSASGENGPPAKPGEADKPSGPASLPPELDLDWWRSIRVGSSVLATAPGVEGWWPCEVLSVAAKGDMLTIRYIGYQEPPFMVPRHSVGLLPPGGAS